VAAAFNKRDPATMMADVRAIFLMGNFSLCPWLTRVKLS
jgi:hypothetical protein